MKLGVDVFSLRHNDWNAFEHLNYAKRIGLDVVHFSDLAPFESLERSYLDEVRKTADSLGIEIETGMGSICPTSTTFRSDAGRADEQLSRMLDIAALLGSRGVRCYVGANADRRTAEPLTTHIDATIATCRAVRPKALDLGIKIALENHAGDLQGRELAALIERAGPEFVGACIDAGNPLWVAESPFTTLDYLAPYVVMSHIRDTAVWPHPDGAAVKWTAMGEGTVGIEAWSRSYIDRCPATHFTLEIITDIAPRVLDYFNSSYWAVYPDMPAAEFVRFLGHVRDGHAPTAPVFTVDFAHFTPEARAALALEQQRQLEKSVHYCRAVLGI
jgi:sugar phosphate isomerase/epimerase